jgi:hypothetical protein
MPQRIDVPGMGVVEFPDGMNDDQISAAIKQNMPQQPSTAADVAKSAGIGVAKGAIGLAGLPGDLAELGAKGINAATGYLGPKLGMDIPQVTGRHEQPWFPTSGEIQKNVEGSTGDFYKPQTTAGKYAQTAGEFLPAIAGGPGGLVRRGLMQVAAPAVASEAAGQATEGTAAEPYARLGAALLAPGGVGLAGRAVTPAPSSAVRQGLVEALQNEGVTSLTAGQRTGNKAIGYAESILGDAPGAGQGATRIQQEGQQQFTEAATRRAGIAGDAGPENLAANSQRLGNEFETLSARNTLQMDPQFGQELGAALRVYDRVPNSQQRAIVQGYADDIIHHAQQSGTMPGPQYQEMRSRLSRQSYGLRQSDPTLSETLGDMRDALDNAMRRSITPADRQAWDTARQQYGAQRTIENAASRAGEVTAEGQITPANLRNEVSARNRGQYARGQGDFAELARAGAGVMSPLPNSGTGQRVAVNTLATALGGGAGAFSGPPGAVAGALAGAAAPAAMGRLLMSRPAQAYLGNQMIPATPEYNRALARALRGQATLPAYPVPQIEGPR